MLSPFARAIVLLIVTTLSAVLMSVSTIYVVDLLLPDWSARFESYAFATGIPLCVAPLMGYPAVYLNYRMEQAQSALARMAHTDVLTGVANRRGFFEHAEKIFRESEASDDRPLALMMVDIDHFKRVNDRYGHAAGDELLKRTARMIHDTVKEKTAPAASLVARIGGEEFAVLIAGADRAEAAALANSICATAPFAGFHSDGNFIHATLSVGVAMRSPGESVDAAMRVADKAVYEAKRAGRDRWVLAVADRFVASSYSADIPPSAMAPAHQAA